MAIEVLFGIDAFPLGLFQEDELGPEVAIMFVVDDWPL